MALSFRLQPGAIFAGAYRVRRFLGQGAMGAVYLAEEQRSGSLRALKIMSPELRADEKFVERFAREAYIGRTIASPYIVVVFASGVDTQSGLPYLVMEYLDGQDLVRWRNARPTLAPSDAVQVITQLFDAIGAAHHASIVHRDLKPENVFVNDLGGLPFVKVLDFGVAKVVRETSIAATAAGLGAPLWSAPEQCGEGRVSPSGDVWSLGLLTFFLLTGKIFWLTANDARSSPYDLALELIRGPIPPASLRAGELGCSGLLPPGFDGWFVRCVARDPADRFPAARIAYAALAPILPRVAG